ncbi:MAG: hypothetical protein FWG56_01950, partial [Desulfovibrionaceae bacterium]|nr:hypothetical protein [Desulfovibrionaceae bacterium]
DIATGALSNRGGAIAAAAQAAVSSQALDNTGGRISGAALTLDTQGARLVNDDGQLLALGGALDLRSGALSNQGGSIQASETARIAANGLDNRNGLIAASSVAVQSQDGAGHWAALDNRGGTLAADQTLAIDSGALDNTRGVIETTQAASALTLRSHGQNIINQDSSAGANMISADGGGILSAGTLTIDAQGGLLDNGNGGYTGSVGNIALTAGRILNRGGTIATDADARITSTAASGAGIDNSNAGVMQAQGNLSLNAGTADIGNAQGTLLANGELTLTNGGAINNHGGSIQAGQALIFAGGAGQSIDNSGGQLYGAQRLEFQSGSLTGGGGSVSTDGDLSMVMAGDFTQASDATLAANGALSLQVQGDFINQGNIKGGSAVTVTGSNIDNQAGATIDSAGVTTVTAENTLTNRGLIDGAGTRINAATVDNVGAGRIYGDHLSIAAGAVRNRDEIVDGAPISATIAARQRLDIGAQTIDNSGGASLLSLGELHIGGALDAARNATGQAQAINNPGSSIQSGGGMSLKALEINNTNAGLAIISGAMISSTTGGEMIALTGQLPQDVSLFVNSVQRGTNPYLTILDGSVSYDHSFNFHLVMPVHPDLFGESHYIEQAIHVQWNCLGAIGFDLFVCQNNDANATYTYASADSPLWAQFGMAPPQGYDTTKPNPVSFGAFVYEGQIVYWKTGSNEAGYNQAVATYNDSMAAVQALDAAITAQNQENNSVYTAQREYTYYHDIASTTYEDQVLSSLPAQISAGGGITIEGQLNNIDSSVIAGGTIDISGGAPNNVATKGARTVITSGIADSMGWRTCGAFSSCSEKLTQLGTTTFNDAPVTTTFDLPTLAFLENQSVATAGVDANGNDGNNVQGHGIQAGQAAVGAGSAAASGSSAGESAGAASSQAQGGPGAAQSANQAFTFHAGSGGIAADASAGAAFSQAQGGLGAGQSADQAFTFHTGSGGIAAGASAGAASSQAQGGLGAGQSAGQAFTFHTGSGDIAVDPSAGAAVNAPPRVTQLQLTSAGGSGVTVRTVTSGPQLPTGSLYQFNAGNPNAPLVETDPAFTSYQQWLGSDYLLAQLGYDPAVMQKRLGDSFYEAQLIQRQVAQLTGRQFLDGYGNLQDEYLALMNAGVSFAKEWNLTPGIALTAEQMAQLTSDIVWLVQEPVTLPDGSVQTVLVPKLYVLVQPGDLSAGGALISGNNVVIDSGGSDVNNSGTIAGRNVVQISGNDINNIGGRITGSQVGLSAVRDINVIGGSVEAALTLLAVAGNDINVTSTTRSASNAQASRTNIDQVASLSVTGRGAGLADPLAGVLAVKAGHDIDLNAAVVQNQAGGALTQLDAGHDLTLGTVATSSAQAITWNASNWRDTNTSAEAATIIEAAGDVRLQAGGDL